MDQTPDRRLRVGIIHPDLGIGGAERLIVDTAVELQNKGHTVEIFTSYFDPKRCFEPARDGTLKVSQMKTYIPRAIAGKLHSVFSVFQQLSLVLQLLLSILMFHYPGTIPHWLFRALSSAPPVEPFDVYLIDQQSFGVPWVKILGFTRVVFYCHFPDKELSNSIAKQKAIARGDSGPSAFRRLYRFPLDLLEEATMDYADKIMVNSEFTQKHFIKSFYRLRRAPRVVYPGINLASFESKTVVKSVGKLLASADGMTPVQKGIHDIITDGNRPLLLSVNRFEAKKNVALALDSFAAVLKEHASSSKMKNYRLVVAGGYDRRVKDNIDTLNELKKQASDLGLNHVTLFYDPAPFEPPAGMPREGELEQASVIFLPSLPGPLLNTLLLNAGVEVLLYTPTDEHFGIVPLEAMACGIPVLATNTGGPVESIADAAWDATSKRFTNEAGTGLLRHPDKKVWAGALAALLGMSEAEHSRMSKAAKQRVKERFSVEAMGTNIEEVLMEADGKGRVTLEEGMLQWVSSVGIFCLMMFAYIWMLRGMAQKEAERLGRV